MKTKHLSFVNKAQIVAQIVAFVILALAIINYFVEFLPFKEVIVMIGTIMCLINFLLIVYLHKKKS